MYCFLVELNRDKHLLEYVVTPLSSNPPPKKERKNIKTALVESIYIINKYIIIIYYININLRIYAAYAIGVPFHLD